MKMIRKYIDGKQQYMFTRIGWCKTCGIPFEKIGKGTGARKYCNICAKNSKRQSKRDYKNTQDKNIVNEYQRNLMNRRRADGLTSDKLTGTTARICGKPPEQPTDQDWLAYHNKIKKMKKDTMGGYQDYHDIDDDYNPYG